MITHCLLLLKAIFLIKITHFFCFFVKKSNFFVQKYFRQTQKVICIIHHVSPTQLKWKFITRYMSQPQYEPIFEVIDNIVDELLTKTYPYPPQKNFL